MFNLWFVAILCGYSCVDFIVLYSALVFFAVFSSRVSFQLFRIHQFTLVTQFVIIIQDYALHLNTAQLINLLNK